MVQPQMENLLCPCWIKTQAKRIFHIISVLHNLETVFSFICLILASSSKEQHFWADIRSKHFRIWWNAWRFAGQMVSENTAKPQRNTSFTLYKMALMPRWRNINSHYVLTTGCFSFVDVPARTSSSEGGSHLCFAFSHLALGNMQMVKSSKIHIMFKHILEEAPRYTHTVKVRFECNGFKTVHTFWNAAKSKLFTFAQMLTNQNLSTSAKMLHNQNSSHPVHTKTTRSTLFVPHKLAGTCWFRGFTKNHDVWNVFCTFLFIEYYIHFNATEPIHLLTPQIVSNMVTAQLQVSHLKWS